MVKATPNNGQASPGNNGHAQACFPLAARAMAIMSLADKQRTPKASLGKQRASPTYSSSLATHTNASPIEKADLWRIGSCPVSLGIHAKALSLIHGKKQTHGQLGNLQSLPLAAANA